jgi:hypothetical protein
MNIFSSNNFNCILNACLYVLRSKVRIIILLYFLEGNSLSHQFQDVHHRNSGAGDTGFSKVNVWIYRNSHFHNIFLKLVKIPWPLTLSAMIMRIHWTHPRNRVNTWLAIR